MLRCQSFERWPVPPLSLHRQTSGNASDTDTQLRGSKRGIAVEPILPMEALMRTDGAVDAEEAKTLAVSEPRERSRHNADGSRVIHVRRSARPVTSTHRIGPSRISFRSMGTGAGEARDGAATSAPGAIPSGRLSPGIVPVEHTASNQSNRPDRRRALVKAFS